MSYERSHHWDGDCGPLGMPIVMDGSMPTVIVVPSIYLGPVPESSSRYSFMYMYMTLDRVSGGQLYDMTECIHQSDITRFNRSNT